MRYALLDIKQRGILGDLDGVGLQFAQQSAYVVGHRRLLMRFSTLLSNRIISVCIWVLIMRNLSAMAWVDKRSSEKVVGDHAHNGDLSGKFGRGFPFIFTSISKISAVKQN